MPEVVDETAFEIDTEFAVVETDTYIPIDDTPAYEETWVQPESDSDARAESSLDDLVEEILRRGVEPDLPEASDTTDDFFAELPSVPEPLTTRASPQPLCMPSRTRPPSRRWTNLPSTNLPSTIRSQTSRRRKSRRRTTRRCRIRRRTNRRRRNAAHVASRGDRTDRADSSGTASLAAAASSADARSGVRAAGRSGTGVRTELEPETTTLSDIAKELGLSIPAPDPKTERWARPARAEPPEEDEAGWEEALRRPSRSRPPQAPAYVPPPPPLRASRAGVSSRRRHRRSTRPIESLHTTAAAAGTRAAPAVRGIPSRTHGRFETPAPAPAPRRSLAERTAGIRESGGPFPDSPRRSSSWWAVSRPPRTAAGATTRA